ncbi:MAG: AarF/UbiB family protein [bacterium]
MSKNKYAGKIGAKNNEKTVAANEMTNETKSAAVEPTVTASAAQTVGEAVAPEAAPVSQNTANAAPVSQNMANAASADEKPAEKPAIKVPTEAEKKAVREAAAAVLEKESKTVKGSKRRSAEIFNVFARHNYYVNGLTPEELRTTLEDLGPTYVKIGQIMSSRGDMLPERFCKELEKLRQNVQPLDATLARAVIEEQTGLKIEDIYSEFRDQPLGSASVGQAHYGVLKDGRKVVTKVRRPYIAEMMRQDFVLLKKLAKGMHIVMEADENADSQLNFVEVIEEFEKVTEEELDFRVEARNTKFFRENCIEDESKITCPEVVDELTTEQIYTMSFVDGYSISKKDRVIADGYDPAKICQTIVENYFHQVLDVGVFHADPHQGNIMISKGKPVWIDFGMIGRITSSDINIIQNLLMGVLEGDSETISTALMSMGTASPKTRRNLLMEDIDNFLDRYVNVSSLSDLNVSVLFGEVIALTEKHHVKLPSKSTMLIRSICTIEGVVEEFCPDLNLFEILSQKLMERAQKNFDLKTEIMNIGKDALEIGKKTAKIPAMASDVLKSLARGRTKLNLELTGYEELVNKAMSTAKSVILALFACVLFFGSSLLCIADLEPKAPGGIPVFAAVGFVIAIGLGIYTIKNFGKK